VLVRYHLPLFLRGGGRDRTDHESKQAGSRNETELFVVRMSDSTLRGDSAASAYVEPRRNPAAASASHSFDFMTVNRLNRPRSRYQRGPTEVPCQFGAERPIAVESSEFGE